MTTSEIHIIMNYEFKLKNNTTNAAQNINRAHGDSVVTERMVQRWFKKFTSADESLYNKPRSRPASIVDNEVLKTLIEEDTCQTSRDLTKRLY